MPAQSHSLSLRECRQVDAACDQFETDWQRQQRPSVEDYLGRAEERVRPALGSELIRIELEWRLRVGEQPSSDDYGTRYPTLAEALPGWLVAAQHAVASRSATPTGSLSDTSDPAVGHGAWQTNPTGAFSPSGPTAVEAVPRVGEYDLIEPIGEGGMGQVWKARHRRLGKLVALKVIRPARQHAPDMVQRFLREMKAIGELDHANVVEASDAGEIDGMVCLAMKLIDGEDLARYVRRRGPLPIAEACVCARQVAQGLQYLHERGLVHRDLKPGNLMRTPEGTIKILDLGLARWQADEPADDGEVTQAGQGLGTPDYMAPEQFAHAATVDIRADLYALGATLFHLLTGRAPFGHIRGTFEKMKAHESTPVADARTLRPEVPGEVAGLVVRLLAKDPADRPATPAEVADALAPFCTGQSVTPPTAPAPARRRRWPIGLGIAAAVVLLLGGTLVLTLALWPEGKDRVGPEPRPGLAVVTRPPVRKVPVRPGVQRFEVSHAERRGEAAVERGLMGVGSFSTRLGDRATVSVVLSRPAYGYLLAYAADGEEFLLDPPTETEAPARREKLQYPPVGEMVEYELNDGVGLHVFLAVVSAEPLPAYAEWKKKRGRAEWGRQVGRVGAVWRQVGGDLHAVTEANPAVRGPGAKQLGVEPVERLAAWWQKQPGIVEVGLTGFAVTGAE